MNGVQQCLHIHASIVPLAVAALSVAIFAQSNQKQQSTPTLRVATHLVTISAVVEDKNGNPVTDLKEDDFEIVDGGQPQRISFFTKFTDQPPAMPQPLPPNTYTNVLAHRGATPPSVTIILFDTLNSLKTSQGWGMEGVRKLLRQIRPGDHVGIYVLGDDLKVVHDFTEDNSDLVQALARSDYGRTTRGNGDAEPSSGILELDRFLNEGGTAGLREQSILDEHYEITLAALQLIGRHLVGVPGRKTLIWVSNSIPSALLSDDLQSYEEATGQRFGSANGFIRGDIEKMVRLMTQDGIAIYPVSAEGFEAMDLNFKETRDVFANGQNMGARVLRTPALDEHVDMQQLAERTGGRAFYNRNDLDTGIRRALDDERFSYMLAYYPDLKKWDGKWRKLQVSVKRPGVTVLARHGYFALADTAPVPPKNHKEEIEQLGQIAASPVDATQVPVYVRLMSPSGVTQLLTQVYFNPRSELKNGSDGRWTGSFQIEFLQLDDKNHVLDATEKSLDVNLLPADFPNVAQHGLEVPASLPSMPHAAVLCVIVRDRNSDAIGSVRIPLEKYAGNQTGRDK